MCLLLEPAQEEREEKNPDIGIIGPIIQARILIIKRMIKDTRIMNHMHTSIT